MRRPHQCCADAGLLAGLKGHTDLGAALQADQLGWLSGRPDQLPVHCWLA
jgi:hypothetical protein